MVLVTLAVLAISGYQTSLWSSEPAKPADKVTYNRDIAPIVYQYCASCHRPGEAGPFPLLTYQDVKKRGHQIVAVTQTRFMPPWLPEPQELKFANERRLTDEQIATIRKWVAQGMLEGKPSDLPPKPKFVEGWQLGEPDLILKAEKAYVLPASGTDQYWNFILPVPIHETRWVRAVEIRPGDKRLVHHANILVDRYESARSLETVKGNGFGGMEVRIASEVFDPDSHFLFWKPGTVVTNEPDGMALRLDKAPTWCSTHTCSLPGKRNRFSRASGSTLPTNLPPYIRCCYRCRTTRRWTYLRATAILWLLTNSHCPSMSTCWGFIRTRIISAGTCS